MTRALIVYLADVLTRETLGGTLSPGVPIPDLPGSPQLRLQWQLGGTVANWIHIQRANGQQFWWRTMLDGADFGDSTRMVGIAWAIDPADNDELVAFAASTPNAWTLPELRADGGAAATQIRAAWRDERPRDEFGVPISGAEVVAIYREIAGFGSLNDQDAFATLAGVT